ncbi:MAG: extracellular solute-binding protein [Hungatella sp.]|nr:extracellular solute-binding protein [Hungatella sp.]
MNVKKRIGAMVLGITVFGQLLCGCASPSRRTPPQSQTGSSEAQTGAVAGSGQASSGDSGEKVSLKWALWSADTQPYWRPIAEAYMESHPNVEIEIIDLGATDYATALQTQLAGNDSPFDVIAVKDGFSFVSMIMKGLLKPLDQSTIDTDSYGGNLEPLMWDGQVYTLPLRSDFYVMFYHKDIFDRAGVPYPTNDMTFEEYDSMVRSLTDTEFGSEVYGTHYHTWDICVQGMASAGEGADILAGDYSYMKPYYEMVLSQQEDKVCMDYSTLKTSGLHYLGAFGQGNVATMLMGTWSIGTLITRINEGQYPDLGEWAVAAFPHKSGAEPGSTIGNFVGMSVINSSKNSDIAEDFVKFAAGAKGAEIVAANGYMPGYMVETTMDTIFSVEGFPTDEVSRRALTDPKTTMLENPLGENSPEIFQVLNTGHDYIMTGTMTVEEGITYMNEQVGKIGK